MKTKLTTLIVALLFSFSANGQNLFFIGESSFQCTETLTFNSNSARADDLNVLFAKDGNSALIGVIATSSMGARFSERLIVYLEDGTVITTTKRKVTDLVDNQAKAAYALTSEQLNQLRSSNIHTIRYSLELRTQQGLLMEEKSHTASNQGISTKTILTGFFE